MGRHVTCFYRRVMVATRLTLVSLLGFTLLADGAALAGTAEAGGSVPSLRQPEPIACLCGTPVSCHLRPLAKRKQHRGDQLGSGLGGGSSGMTFSYLPLPVLESEIGVGLGYTGWQFSAMQKVALGWGSTRFVAGVGCSYSSGSDLPLERNNDGFRDFWLNFDLVGFEVRTRSHLVFFLAAGGTYKFGKPIHVELMSIDCQDSTDACGSPAEASPNFAWVLADGSSRRMGPPHWPVVELVVEYASKVRVSGESVTRSR